MKQVPLFCKNSKKTQTKRNEKKCNRNKERGTHKEEYDERQALKQRIKKETKAPFIRGRNRDTRRKRGRNKKNKK